MREIETLTKRIDTLLEGKSFVLIAIDGSCTSGKTTLAERLSGIYDCNVFHMDDFFLRPEQRTAARYAQPGGNVDYERFREELLLPLLAGGSFSYRPFDCKSLRLSAPLDVSPKALNIIEGSYSQHPYFDEPYDLKIFLTVSDEDRRQRIMLRPERLRERFFNEWIPMEQKYFEAFSIKEKADIIL